MDDAYFGSDHQQALLRRGRALYALTRDDPRFGYYGRLVSLTTPDDGDLDLLCHLIALQGAASYTAVPNADVPALTRRIEARGLAVNLYRRWTGGETALAAAAGIARGIPLPADLTLHRIDADAPPQHLAQLADVALTCSVLPPAGGVLRGQIKPGAGLVAVDADNRAVCCAGAAALNHRDHPTLGAETWWGMLATHPDRRGQKLALSLGAYVMRDMHHRFGRTRFMTGIQPGNTASEAVCARMGLAPDGSSILNVVDPTALPGGKMTS